jgi:hypothetical protein
VLGPNRAEYRARAVVHCGHLVETELGQNLRSARRYQGRDLHPHLLFGSEFGQ